MNILFLSNSVLGHYHSPAVDYQPSVLAEHGHRVTLIGRSGGSADFLRGHGVRTLEIDAGDSLASAAKQAAKEEQPDIVHVFDNKNYAPFPLWLRSVCHAKYVLDIRSPLLVRSVKRYWYKLRHGLIARLYDMVVTPAPAAAWSNVGKYGKIVETGIGVDLSMIPCRIRQAEPKCPISAVYIGSVSERRGSLAMIEAVRRASRKVDIRLDIYGAATEEFAARHMATSTSDPVRFLGLLPRAELFRRLADYEMGLSYIPKALYDPAPPLKTLEYLANGLPTVATNTQGNARFIRHEWNGLLTPEDTETFAEAIVRMASDHELRHTISKNSRPSIESEDWNRVVLDRLLPVYRQLLGATGVKASGIHAPSA